MRDVKCNFYLLTVVSFFLFCMFLPGCGRATQMPRGTTNKQITLKNLGPIESDPKFRISNNYQLAWSVALTTYKGELFQINEHASKDNIRYLGSTEGFVYYTISYTKEDDVAFWDDVYCYSFDTGKSTLLLTVPTVSSANVYYDDSNRAYIPRNSTLIDNYAYYVVSGDMVLEDQCQLYGYTFGGYRYFCVHQKGESAFEDALYQCTDDDESSVKKQIFSGESLTMHPTANGLVIHKRNACDMLYFVDGESGEISELHTTTGISTKTAVNTYGDYVFVSYIRYKKTDESGKFLIRFENDTLSGTYRINLRDGSVVRISEEVYDALYIFAEGIIYGTGENGQISKIDFDGTSID